MVTAPRLVRILWTDACGDAPSWTSTEHLDRVPTVVTTVGSLVEPPVRPAHTTVALSWHDDHDGSRLWDSVVHIPDGMIVHRDDLTAPIDLLREKLPHL